MYFSKVFERHLPIFGDFVSSDIPIADAVFSFTMLKLTHLNFNCTAKRYIALNIHHVSDLNLVNQL